MAKRKGGKRRPRPAKPTVDYPDDDGNVLTLRESLTPMTVAKIRRVAPRGGTTFDDAWQRRTEMLFERLAVRWEIAGMPIDDQKMLLGRYRMADSGTKAWVRRTIDEHVERHIPQLLD